MDSLNISKTAWLYILLLITVLLPGLARAETHTVTYYIPDAQGSPIVAIDRDSGTVKWRKHYRPYGEEIEQGAASADNRISYTGHVHDRASGLTYMGARYYDPEIGRFLSMDPAAVRAEDPWTFNRYAYANNGPYNFVDPDGWDSYLISRPLGFTDLANHNFIVTNAKSLGDPNAKVISFGNTGNGEMGEVNKNTKGFSAGTAQTDKKSWQNLSKKVDTVTFRKINATDKVVDDLASKVDKGKKYTLIPELQGGVNSNTAAGAVAKKADGGFSFVNNGISQPGSTVTNRIEFK